MTQDLVAKSAVSIKAPATRVWDALVTPSAIKQYMFGTDVDSDWHKGSSIIWRGEWHGTPYEDKGVIRRFEPEHIFEYSHYSPLAGKPDIPENYHTVTIELSEKGAATLVTLSQDNNATEESRQHSQKNWDSMLAGLKKFVESPGVPRSGSHKPPPSAKRKTRRKSTR